MISPLAQDSYMHNTLTQLCLVQVREEVMNHEREERKYYVDTYIICIATDSQQQGIYQIG